MQYKKSYNELTADHEVLYKSYINELTKNSKIQHSISVLKRISNKLSKDDNAILCQSCINLLEVSALKKLLNSDVFDKTTIT